ncbi:4-hydroxy-tetrahydrodipicolinate reductase [Quillaja saponaria]|uniref:4-hydroxy-tetrahydrodipicolinate reductase n=1 Tax=Quillaja saponaria TaxID=32244 RepID=A0AAD7PNX7_QUISA|nr:4-hydroxy-tetrahydrodipicolinate reductase [Quillaja saponaria]
MEAKEEEEGLAIWDCGSPLYDSHELVSMSHIIDRHLMALPSLGGSKPFITHQSNAVVSLLVDEIGCKGNSKGSSMVASLGGFMVRKIWKKRVASKISEQLKTKKIG